MTFTPAMIDTLRAEYGKINAIDPCGPSYAKLTAMLDKLPREALQQLATAEPRVKFVSLLANNRLNRKG